MSGSELPPSDDPRVPAGQPGAASSAPVSAPAAGPAPGPAPTPAPTAGSAPRWMRWLLVLSLAANLLVLGLAGGAAIKRVRHGPVPMQVRDLSIGPFTQALTPEDREALRKDFIGRVGSGPKLGAELRADFTALLAALRTTPYDPAATADVFAQFRSRNLQRLATGEDLLQARIAAMTPEARAAFADRIEAGLKPAAAGDHETRRERREERRDSRQGAGD